MRRGIVVQPMVNKSLRKLHDRRGESLAEVLAAMLVMALGMTLLVSMLAASSKLIAKSDSRFSRKIGQKNNIEAVGNVDGAVSSGELHGNLKITGENGSAVTGKDPDFSSSLGNLKISLPVIGENSDNLVLTYRYGGDK